MVPLKYLSNFWRINLILTLSEKCVLSNDTKSKTFVITDTRLYIPVVPLSTLDNAKLLQQSKSGFKSIN